MDPALQKAFVALTIAQTHPNFWVIGGQITSACIGVVGAGIVAWYAAARSARLAARQSIEAQTERIAKTLGFGLRAETLAVKKIIEGALSNQPEQVRVPVAALGDRASLSAVYRGASSNLGTLDAEDIQRHVEFYISLASIPAISTENNLPIFHRKDLLDLKKLAENSLG